MSKPVKTVLSVPASSARMLRRAVLLTPGATMLDLEDGVSDAEKVSARALLNELRHLFDSTSGRWWLRVNPPESRDWEADLELIEEFGDRLDAVVIPKASPTALNIVGQQIARPIVALVETAAGIEQSYAMAEIPGVVGFMFGGLDYALDLSSSGGIGVTKTEWAEARLVNAAAACGKWAVASPTADLKVTSLLQMQASQQRSLGFVGKLCIHPNQLPTVERVFTPSNADCAWAQKILRAVSQQSSGAVAVDGEMIDRPVIERARHILGAAPADAS